MSTDLLFVYGTLMSPFDHPNAKHLHAKARCLGAARMPGILYQVTWYPGATDRLNHHANASESWVYGELWQLDTELLLTEIDHYEECRISNENFDRNAAPQYDHTRQLEKSQACTEICFGHSQS